MDDELRFHKEWLGLAEPRQGLVASPHALVNAQCAKRLPKEVQLRLIEMCPGPRGKRQLRSLPELLEGLLQLAPARFDSVAGLPIELCLEVADTGQTIRPTLALRREGAQQASQAESAGASIPAARAGAAYELLIWDVPAGLPLDESETQTGPWEASAHAKFDRLLRACRVPIGLLSNSVELRLVYAPEDAASGYLPFRISDMCESDGRPLLDALVMLLSDARWRGGLAEHRLPALLRASRERQVDVTTDISLQVFEALEILLAGFEVAAERDPEKRLNKTLQTEPDAVYAGLLTVLLRIVFLLYCEDRGLMPSTGLFREHYGINALFEQLQHDRDRHPDTMALRYGAYARLVALFRLVYLGGEHVSSVANQGFNLPERRGELFDPNQYPFLEGWGPGGSAPLHSSEERQAVDLPAVDDGTIHRVLQRLILLGGERLSYRSLRVEQIGSVYEKLMGFTVERQPHGVVRLNLKASTGYWLSGKALLERSAEERIGWLKDELGFEKNMAEKIARAASDCKAEEEVLEKLEAIAGRNPERALAGSLVLQPGPQRRRTSSHYTPPDLARSVVERALEPLVRTIGPRPGSENILSLVVCDPAMGSGAFLVAACEYLAGQLLAAWDREGQHQQTGNAKEDARVRAKRLIAQRCLFGVDSNRYAVQLARMSLWLTTLSVHEPFTFVDHALRHGDSLVGLGLDQIQRFHWKPDAQLEFLHVDLRHAVSEALAQRRLILELARDPSVRTTEKQRLLFQANDALSDLRLVGDVLVGAFFAHVDDTRRENERKHRADLVQRWWNAPGDEQRASLRVQLEAMRDELRRTQNPFHWMLEFPEVFCDDREDPLDGQRPNGKAWVDAFVGNPPFAGKNEITQNGGPGYLEWLQAMHIGAHGNADYSAHFLRRCHALLGRHGTIGLITTKTIGQGETRVAGLVTLVNDGLVIYSAHPYLKWPGEAKVRVSIVHLAAGNVRDVVQKTFRDRQVDAINTRLRPKLEPPIAAQLLANAECAFVGSYVLGTGFTLTAEERTGLIRNDRKNARRIFPYLGGKEMNRRSDQSHERYVISFGQMELEEAEEWPDLIAIVRKKVKPKRCKNNRENYKKYWWRFAEARPGLYAAIAPLKRCLVMARDPKHFCFAFQPTDRIFSEKLYVFPLASFASFGTLQSRVHLGWAYDFGRTTGGAGTPSYTTEECFATFPFPTLDPRSPVPALEPIAQNLYTARADFMRDSQQGLTTTYNLLHDPNCRDGRIVELRELHEALDRAVLDAYGWSDIPVPPYCVPSLEDDADFQAFKEEVIDRLFDLNAKYSPGTTTPARPGQEVVGPDEEPSGEGKSAMAKRQRPANDLRPPSTAKPRRTAKKSPPSKPPSSRRRGAA